MPAYDADQFTPPAPLALVSLRNNSTGLTLSDVPMLLDSGADVTLIPQVSVSTLGVSAVAGAGYELIGFDGTKSVAEAVELDLLFMRRAFKGRFLVVDQAWGIMGRDVLNHIAIVLNGPQLTWAEHKGA